MYLESIKQEETKLVKTQDDLQAHKDKASLGARPSDAEKEGLVNLHT